MNSNADEIKCQTNVTDFQLVWTAGFLLGKFKPKKYQNNNKKSNAKNAQYTINMLLSFFFSLTLRCSGRALLCKSSTIWMTNWLLWDSDLFIGLRLSSFVSIDAYYGYYEYLWSIYGHHTFWKVLTSSLYLVNGPQRYWMTIISNYSNVCLSVGKFSYSSETGTSQFHENVTIDALKIAQHRFFVQLIVSALENATFILV